MSERVGEIFLFDIFVAISKIEVVSERFDSADALVHDFANWDSIIREFEIIGEATNICIKNSLIDKEYRIIVDFRNKIIHHYFGIDHEAVWNIVHDNLQDFKAYIISQIHAIEDKDFQRTLLNATKEDNKKYPQILLHLEALN